MGGIFGLPTEVGLDRLLIGGILGGNVQELSCRAWGLTAIRVDKRLAGCATDEGVVHVASVMLGSSLRFLEKC